MKPKTLTSALLLLATAAGAPACTKLIGDIEIIDSPSSSGSVAPTTSTGGGPQVGSILRRPRSVDKIDLLLMIDNSRSMADKQQILADAVPDLVKGLVNPKCIDPNTGKPSLQQPNSPVEPCPPGTTREFAPVFDIHIGIISSSLGGHGSDTCLPKDFGCPSGTNPSNNDAGRLLSRTDACSTDPALNVVTYDASPGNTGKGFLAWDPAMRLTPVGETKIEEIVPKLRDMVVGVGQIGCGFESQFESWYRFLVDPEPYVTIPIQDGQAVPTGVDQALLQQRADFLRPSSLLAIVMLTDENDCSVKEFGTNFLSSQLHVPTGAVFHLPRPRKECATDPNDPCCKPCSAPLDNCPPDPTCSQPLSDTEDNINLRCFDQKRRFGAEFLYPIDRYTQALNSLKVPNRQGDLVENPIYADLDPLDGDSYVRDNSFVVLTGIVGVPWQLIARDPKDLRKGFKSALELDAPTSAGGTTWDLILGDPAKYTPPKDAHMVEAIQPRAGLPTAVDAAGGNVDPLNGHEYSVPQNDDLQYACIFDLPTPRDCSQSGVVSCDCSNSTNDNPLCNPQNPQQQIKAKSYPGLRELALLKSVGDQGVVASVCPAQISDASGEDYGYRPAFTALLARLKTNLQGCGASPPPPGQPCAPPPCEAAKTCLDAVQGDAQTLCTGSPSANAYDALSRCACQGPCAAACSDACKMNAAPITPMCQACLHDMKGCGAELDSCLGH